MDTIKTILFSCFLISSSICYAQSDNANPGVLSIEKRKNEIKVGIFSLYPDFIPRIEIERILKSSLSYGVFTRYNFNSTESNLNYSLTPFLRVYFYKDKVHGANGFFAQGLLTYSNVKNTFDNDPYNSMGIGLGVGKKWITTKGFTLQLSLSGGGNFYVEESTDRTFLKGDISLGYRY